MIRIRRIDHDINSNYNYHGHNCDAGFNLWSNSCGGTDHVTCSQGDLEFRDKQQTYEIIR